MQSKAHRLAEYMTGERSQPSRLLSTGHLRSNHQPRTHHRRVTEMELP